MDALSIRTIFWKTSWKIPGTPWSIRGYSRSSFRTGFHIPELNILLDAGNQSFNKPSHIFITHSHADHIANLPLTLIGNPEGNHIFQIYAPQKSCKYIENYIQSMFQANSVSSMDTRDWFDLNYVAPEQIFEIDVKNTRLSVEVFECDHSIPTVSYGFTELKKKLKSEFRGLSGKEIKRKKDMGIAIDEIVEFRRFAYVCDTSIDVFNLNKSLLSYPVIFIECTMFGYDQKGMDLCSKKKHVHWLHLEPYVRNNPDTLFVLFHFSLKYTDKEISEFFESQPYKNIKWWVCEEN